MTGQALTEGEQQQMLDAYRALVWSAPEEEAAGLTLPQRLLERRAPVATVTAMRDAGVPVYAWLHLLDYAVPADIWGLGGGDAGDWQNFARCWDLVEENIRDWHGLLGADWSAIWHLLCADVPLTVVIETHRLSPQIARRAWMANKAPVEERDQFPIEELPSWIRAGLVAPDNDSIFQFRVDFGQIATWQYLIGARAARYAAAGLSLDEAVTAEADGGWEDDRLAVLAALRGC